MKPVVRLILGLMSVLSLASYAGGTIVVDPRLIGHDRTGDMQSLYSPDLMGRIILQVFESIRGLQVTNNADNIIIALGDEHSSAELLQRQLGTHIEVGGERYNISSLPALVNAQVTTESATTIQARLGHSAQILVPILEMGAGNSAAATRTAAQLEIQIRTEFADTSTHYQTLLIDPTRGPHSLDLAVELIRSPLADIYNTVRIRTRFDGEENFTYKRVSEIRAWYHANMPDVTPSALTCRLGGYFK